MDEILFRGKDQKHEWVEGFANNVFFSTRNNRKADIKVFYGL